MKPPVADAIGALPPLRETIAAHGLDARKRFGQHFLLDLNLTRRIARSAAPLDEGTIIEIGRGPGGLTRALLMEGAQHVVALEVDPRAVGALRHRWHVRQGGTAYPPVRARERRCRRRAGFRWQGR